MAHYFPNKYSFSHWSKAIPFQPCFDWQIFIKKWNKIIKIIKISSCFRISISMDGWSPLWLNVPMDGWSPLWLNVPMDGWSPLWLNVPMDGWSPLWLNLPMDGWSPLWLNLPMDGWSPLWLHLPHFDSPMDDSHFDCITQKNH
jgi:hypothetical protein